MSGSDPAGKGGVPGGATSADSHELTALELAFARDPASSAFLPLVKAYLAQDRLMEAMVVCKRGYKANPEASEARLLLAKIYGRQGKMGDALAELDALVSADPDSAAALSLRGELRAQSGDEAGAVEDYKRALNLDPYNTEAGEALKARGIVWSTGGGSSAPIPKRALLEGEEELEAIAAEAVGSARGPRKGPAKTIALVLGCLIFGIAAVVMQFRDKADKEAIDKLIRSGKSSFEQDTYADYQKALQAFDRVLAQYDAAHPAALAMAAHAQAILWSEHGDGSRADVLASTLERAQAAAPDAPHTLSAEGIRMLSAGTDRTAAAEKARAYLSAYVDKLKAQGRAAGVAEMTLGLAELESGHYADATTRLQASAQFLHSSVRARVLSARAALRFGRLGTAESVYSSALRRSGGKHPAALAERALVRLRRGNLPGAADDVLKFDSFAAKYPKDVSNRDRALVEFARSESLRAAGEEAAAVGAYASAIRFDPQNADLPFGSGMSLLERGDPAAAMTMFTKALELQPNRPAFLVAMADAEIQTGNFKSADKRLALVLEQRPKSIDANIVKARLLRAQGAADAEAFHRQFVEWSRSVAAKLELVRLLRGLDDQKGAQALLESAIEDLDPYPARLKSEVLFEYGDLSEALGESGTAVNSFRQAAELGRLTAWFRLARLRKGGDRRARSEAKRACRRYLAAGAAQRFYQEADALCQGL